MKSTGKKMHQKEKCKSCLFFCGDEEELNCDLSDIATTADTIACMDFEYAEVESQNKTIK
jgi:hypothetical protein